MPANNKMVPLAGLEPALCCQKRILNPSRLPIPPQRPKREALQCPSLAHASITSTEFQKPDKGFGMRNARTLLQSIESMADEAGPEGYTLRQIMDRLDERAFGAALFMLALPCCIPFLYIVPQIVALPMMALAAQMALGREEPWLPKTLSDRRIDKEGLTNTAKGGRKWFGWVETIAKPRLTFLTGKGIERLIGLILCVFCASILVPLPMTNTIPGFAVAAASFGLIQRDGLLVLAGLILGLAWVSLLVYGLVFGLEFVAELAGSLMGSNAAQ